jgi:hypothetical protein
VKLLGPLSGDSVDTTPQFPLSSSKQGKLQEVNESSLIMPEPSDRWNSSTFRTTMEFPLSTYKALLPQLRTFSSFNQQPTHQINLHASYSTISNIFKTNHSINLQTTTNTQDVFLPKRLLR